MSKTIAEIGMMIAGTGLIAIGALTGNPLLEGLGVTAVLSGFGLLLRPPVPGGPATSTSFDQGVSPRRVVYGQFQTAGVLTYASFPPSQNLSTDNQYLHLLYTLTGHEILSFDAVVVDGYIYNFGASLSDILWDSTALWWHVDPGPSPTIQDFYWQHMFFEFDFGRANSGAQPFPNLALSDPAWTSACLQRACAKVHVILRADTAQPALYPSGQIPNIEFLITGKRVLDPRVVTAWQASTAYTRYSYIIDNHASVWVLLSAGGTSGSTRPNFEATSTPGTTLTDGSLTWTQCTFPFNNISSTAIAWNNRIVNDGWPGGTATLYSVMESLGYLYVCTVAGATGAVHPNLTPTQGTATTDGSATWVCLGPGPLAANPSNSALAVYDYLQDSDAGMAASPASIDTASVIAAANVCEDQALIIWNLDGTKVYENQYACDGIFDHTQVRGNVLQALCDSMAGWIVPPGDMWHLYAGAYVSPIVSLTDDDMRGPVKGDFRLSKRDVANSIKGTYRPQFLPPNPAAAITLTQAPKNWQSQNFPPYQANGLAGKPNYLNSEDGSQVIWQDITLDFTTSVWMAQRLAKIVLMRLRFQQTLTLQCKMTAFQIEAGDTFGLFHARWGINGGIFEAIQASLSMEGTGSGKSDAAPTIGVDFVARQVDPSIYSFTPPQSAGTYGEYSPFGVTGVFSGVE